MIFRISLRWPDSVSPRLRSAWPWLVVFALSLLALAGYGWPSVRSPADPLGGKAPAVTSYAHEVERMTDGVVATPGSRWNCELASVIASGGSVEWDFGRVVPISRAFIQADNDDIYAIVVSNDRKHWSDLWEALPTETAGLSNRQATGLKGAGRYVRLEPRGGDGNYSVAELRLSSSSDGPWPPAFDARPGHTSEVRGEGERNRLIRIAAALAGGSLMLTWMLRRRWRAPLIEQPLVWVTAVTALALVATALGYAAKHRFNVVDDAYISLQYAKNWISGNGLVFNPGELVEGYTNFLWTALLTPLWPLSGRDPLLMTRMATWLAVALAVAALGLVAAISRRTFPKNQAAGVLAVLLLAFDDSFLAYTVVFALENHLLIALMLAGFALAEYRPRRWDVALGATFALVGMTRPDGLLWGGTFLLIYGGAALLRARKGTASETDDSRAQADDPRARRDIDRRTLVRIAITFGAVFSAYFCWRYWYYGELLPNTFHLKVGSTLQGIARGMNYVRAYFGERHVVPLIGLLAIGLTRALWVRWLFTYVVLHMAYIVYVGGDFYAGHRFLLAITPCLALLTACVFAKVVARTKDIQRRRALVVAAVAGVVAVRWGTLKSGPFVWDLYGSNPVVENNVQYMRWLKDVARPNSSMIVGDIGATGFFADVRVIDYFGVVDLDVARKHVPTFGTGKPGHEKVLTREEQLARKPTYIKWGYVDDSKRPPGYYIFNDFPRHLRVEGLWVLDDLARGRVLPERSIHFDPAELRTWTRSGTAFQNAPSRGATPGQWYVNGQFGSFINTFTKELGDRAVGRLLSPPFPLEGDRMRLLVGGGRDPERLRVSLLIDNRRVFSETGTNWETLGRREWNIAPYRGKMARLEIVDEATGAWGHILVDEVEQWVGTPNETGKL